MAKAKAKRAKARPAAKAKPAATSKATSKAKTQTKTKTVAKTKAKAVAKTKAAATAKSSAKPKRVVHTKAAATAKAKPAAKPKPRARTSAAMPTAARPGGRVVDILDDAQPVEALRRFLERLPAGPINLQAGQVALGAAQLMLLPIARDHRGGPEVHALLDLVLGRWARFGEHDGFHAQEFLRNAFAAVGNDPDRIAALAAHLPEVPSPELSFTVACAYAIADDHAKMIMSVRAALAAGVSTAQFRHAADFAAVADDEDLRDLLEGGRPPEIPVDIAPFVPSVRGALAELRATLERFGEPIAINPPADLAAVLELERAARIQLPNDYRALLTIADGVTLFDRAFFSLADYRIETPLATNARAYLEASARDGATGIDECVPLANWGQPNDWLLYDPRGIVRHGDPGYVLMMNADEHLFEDLVAALEHITELARDVLATN